MYEVTYSVNGIIERMQVSNNNYTTIFNMITNMYSNSNVQIINIRRI